MRNAMRVGLAVVASVGVVSFASAGVIETDSARLIRTDAIGGGLNQDGVFTNMGPSIYGFWSDSLTSASDDGGGLNSGDGFASQFSTISAASYEGVLMSSASASGDGFDITNGYGESSFMVEFTLNSTMDFEMVGSMMASGDGTLHRAMYSLVNLDTMSILNGESVTSTGTGISFTTSLGPGNYRFSAQALSIADQILEFFEDSESSSAQISFTVGIIPAPATIGVFSLAGLASVRRRR